MNWVAGYAALVATIGALWQIRLWWNDRDHIRVRQAFALTPAGLSGATYLITLTAVNVGRLSVYLDGAGFVIEDKKDLLPMEGIAGNPGSQLPCDLLPGRSFTMHIPAQVLLASLVENNSGVPPRTGWFRDATGKRHVTKINARNFQNWVRQIGDLS